MNNTTTATVTAFTVITQHDPAHINNRYHFLAWPTISTLNRLVFKAFTSQSTQRTPSHRTSLPRLAFKTFPAASVPQNRASKTTPIQCHLLLTQQVDQPTRWPTTVTFNQICINRILCSRPHWHKKWFNSGHYSTPVSIIRHRVKLSVLTLFYLMTCIFPKELSVYANDCSY